MLSTAVSEGMDVQNSILNSSTYICVAPDQPSLYSVPLTASVYSAPSHVANSCCCEGGDAGRERRRRADRQGWPARSGAKKGANYWSNTVQGALAAVLEHGFHRPRAWVGTQNIINMAAQYGVKPPLPASFSKFKGGVGIALGIAPLTVQEQDTMLATIANNGYYHQAHMVKYWQSPGLGSGEQAPKVAVALRTYRAAGRGRAVRDGR